ncbi:MAG: BrnA antitoxin family protein [Pseudomonadota bacterium]
MTKRSPAERQHVNDMMGTLEEIQMEMAIRRRGKNIVPKDWPGVADYTPCGKPKKRMTIRLEAEVLDWYQALGQGYQNRINAVLKAYMHGIISKVLSDDRDDMDMWMNLPKLEQRIAQERRAREAGR